MSSRSHVRKLAERHLVLFLRAEKGVLWATRALNAQIKNQRLFRGLAIATRLSPRFLGFASLAGEAGAGARTRTHEPYTAQEEK